MRVTRTAGALIAGLVACAAACLSPPRAPSPMRIVPLAEAQPGSPCLVVFLPGRYDAPEEFRRRGFAQALTDRRPGVAAIAVDAHLGYYADEVIVERLHTDVIAPALADGRRVWLVGISLGGLGALVYAREHPGELTGLVVLAPYLGEDDVIREIENAGGLRRWPGQRTDRFHGVWSWLKGYDGAGEERPPLFLGYGRDDRLAGTAALLAGVLPASRVQVVAGGHDWAAWLSAWKRLLDAGAVCTPPRPR